MHFSDTPSANSSKTTKIATVVVIHILLGYGIMQSMKTVRFTPPTVVDPVDIIKVDPPKPKEPELQPKVEQQTAPELPQVPIPEVKIDTPPIDPPIAVVFKADPVTPTGPVIKDVPVTEKQVTQPGIRTAVFAEGCAVPEYPTSSLRNGEEGTVVLALMVNAAGKVDNARVTKSSGHRSLDRAAQNALSLCKFQPAMADGQPQAGWAQISYNWKLEN